MVAWSTQEKPQDAQSHLSSSVGWNCLWFTPDGGHTFCSECERENLKVRKHKFWHEVWRTLLSLSDLFGTISITLVYLEIAIIQYYTKLPVEIQLGYI